MAVPPTELLDSLMDSAPLTLRIFRDKYKIKKLFLIRAAQYYETLELLLILIIIAYKLPDYEGSISFDLSLFLLSDPDNIPFHILEQSNFDSQQARKQLISDGKNLSNKINLVGNMLEKRLSS